MAKFTAKGREVWVNTSNHNGPEDTPCEFKFCEMGPHCEDPEAMAEDLAKLLNETGF